MSEIAILQGLVVAAIVGMFGSLALALIAERNAKRAFADRYAAFITPPSRQPREIGLFFGDIRGRK